MWSRTFYPSGAPGIPPSTVFGRIRVGIVLLFVTFLSIVSVNIVHASLSLYWNLMRLSSKWELKLAWKPGLTHYFRHKKMSVPSQKYDSCIFIRCVLAFDFVIWLSILNFNRSLVFYDFTFFILYENVRYSSLVESHTKNDPTNKRIVSLLDNRINNLCKAFSQMTSFALSVISGTIWIFDSVKKVTNT